MEVTGVGEPPPEGTKKGLTPLAIFYRRFRDMIRKEHPEFTFSQIGCELGARWKKLSDVEKAVYHDSSLSSLVSEEPKVASPIYFHRKALEVSHGAACTFGSPISVALLDEFDHENVNDTAAVRPCLDAAPLFVLSTEDIKGMIISEPEKINSSISTTFIDHDDLEEVPSIPLDVWLRGSEFTEQGGCCVEDPNRIADIPSFSLDEWLLCESQGNGAKNEIGCDFPKSQHSRQVAALDLASSESISGINDTAATFLTPRSVSFSTDITRFPALSSDCPCSGSLDKAATLKMPKTRYRKSKAKLKQSSEIDSPAASSLKKPEANRHRKAKAKLKQSPGVFFCAYTNLYLPSYDPKAQLIFVFSGS